MAENVTESAAPEAAPAPTPAATNAVDAAKNSSVDNAETSQQVEGGEAKTEPSGLEALMQSPGMLIILGVLWLWVIFSFKKNKRRQKERQEKLNQINKGDKVVTIGRVHGTVVDVDDKTFTIKPDNKKDYTMTFDREALLRVENRPDGDSTAS